MTNIRLAVCDWCMIAVPVRAEAYEKWLAKHNHDDEGDE